MKRVRSPLSAFLLAAFLGPVGFMYTNLIGGLVLIILTVVTLWTIAVPLAVWLLCAASAPFIVASFNKKTVPLQKGADRKFNRPLL